MRKTTLSRSLLLTAALALGGSTALAQGVTSVTGKITTAEEIVDGGKYVIKCVEAPAATPNETKYKGFVYENDQNQLYIGGNAETDPSTLSVMTATSSPSRSPRRPRTASRPQAATTSPKAKHRAPSSPPPTTSTTATTSSPTRTMAPCSPSRASRTTPT